VLSLTYRQFMFFWERYLHRQKYEIQLKIDLDPWIKKEDNGAGTMNFDLSTEEGMAALEEMGVAKVKTRRVRQKKQDSA